MIPWRYGATSAEGANSWIYCRIQDCAPKASVGAAALLFRVGGPSAGVVESANHLPESAHLPGWDLSDFSVWRTKSPAPLPHLLGLRPDAIYRTPQLPGGGIHYQRLPMRNFAFLEYPPIGRAAPPPAVFPHGTAVPSESGRSLSRGASRARSKSPPPRWMGGNSAASFGGISFGCVNYTSPK